MLIQLRAAETRDALPVAQLLIATREVFMPYAPLAHTNDEVRDWVRRVLIPTGGVVVATSEENVVGVMATDREGNVAWITQMAVMPSLVNQTIGSQLLHFALQTMDRPIRLYTFQANHGARRFYERFGFRPIRFTDGQDNEERCPDVLYELGSSAE